MLRRRQVCSSCATEPGLRSRYTTTMQDPHPLAIIPLQKNLLPPDTSSSSSSVGSSPNSSTAGANAPLVPIRALVAHKGTAAAGLNESVRSEDDAALMRSLISLLPHERADSQFSVTSPVRRSDPPDGARNESWFRARPGVAFSGGDDGSSCSTTGSNGASFSGGRKEGEGRAGGGGSGSGGGNCSQSVPIPAGRGPGLDFLGTTDSVRDLLHLPYTSDAVTVGLHRVGQTLVLDGNLGEVLAPTADAAKASVPAPPPPSRGGASTSSPGGGAATINGPGSSPPGRTGIGSNTVVGGGDKEGRWVMVGRGGKPQRDEEGWEHEKEEGGGARGADGGVAAPAFARDEEGTGRGKGGGGRGGGGGAVRSSGKGRGWENTGGFGGREQATSNAGARAGWSVKQGSWPTLGAPASDLVHDEQPGGGILSIVPGRSPVDSFGVRPPEPAGFWRAVQWELGGMHLMLGSSLPVCSTTEHPQVSVRLHDGDEDLSLCTCLDYYLDNVMENVPELALCMREKGYIQGCRLVSTEDIPYLGSLTRKAAHDAASSEARPQVVGRDVDGSAPLFDPGVVELNATMLLRFLQENCSREGGTYLLHRSEGAAHVQLYDVSALSRQRHRRWKWLLAMLCYRFAVRISHHTRQPWCRGGRPAGASGQGSSSADGPVDTSPGPGPEVVRHLQRRQRQLLENSLELLEELAQLGGGGHETICASVQEHIADTYLGYGTVNGTLMWPGIGDGDGDHARGRPRRGGRVPKATAVDSAAAEPAGPEEKSRSRQPWTVDSEGGVWTSPPPPVQMPTAGKAGGGATNKKGKRRGGKASGAARGKATRGGKAGSEGAGGLHPASVRLGGGGSAEAASADGDERVERSSGQQREDYLDKAQDHLTSGIAILRGVMARQESAAAGRDGSAADLVVVGESQLPVAIMRQQQSPWLAVDEEDDEEEDGNTGRGGEHQAGDRRGGDALPERLGPRRGRRRRGSRDESEDPVTAMSVVSEQLWGLQQKLVGTYVAAARVRLGRAFPGPSITTSEGSISASSGGKQSRRSGEGTDGGGGSRGGSGGKGGGMPPGLARGELEDSPDEETCTELVRLALDSLRNAWEHLKDATVTLDRRSAAVFPATGPGVGGDSTETTDDDQSVDISEEGLPQRGIARPDGARSKESTRHHSTPEQGRHASGRGEPAEGLGSLWKGSLSEALARSGGSDGDATGHGSIGVDGEAPTLTDDASGAVDSLGRVSASKLGDADDAMGCLAWNRSARRQLEARRAELFELCGDVAHACVVLRAGEARSGAVEVTLDRGGSAPSARPTEPKGSLLARLEGLLSSACPPLTLKDLDVCQDLHGHVLEALSGKTNTRDTNISSSKKGRAAQARATAEARGGGSIDEVREVVTRASVSSSGETVVMKVVPDGKEENAKLSSTKGSSSDPSVLGDPSPLNETCVHSLAKLGHVPGDATAWSLCLAAEACYERALLCLGRSDVLRSNPELPAAAVAAAVSHRRRGNDWLDKGGYASGGVAEAHARLRKKLGDASNELGKLMAQCAGALAQVPTPPSLSPGKGEVPASTSSTTENSPRSTPHPGLGCAVCAACADRWFRRSLVDFRAIDDARNTALLLCNIASVERLKPRALARLSDACPTIPLGAGAAVSGGGGGGRGSKPGGGKEGGLTVARGAAAAVDLCGEAHAVLGRRDADVRTWEHASRELAMAYLCLGVERRQELLGRLRGPDPVNGPPEQTGAKRSSSADASSTSESSAPSVAQARGVVEPLERALQIYTDMQNAPQAAACHYQIGQYYAKVLPAYVGLVSAPDSSASASAVGGGGGGGGGRGGGGGGSNGDDIVNGASRNDARSALQASKAWETGQRAARHFLAARAYFAPFERGPTSVILALDLCDLYLFLADMGNAGGGAASAPFAGPNAPPPLSSGRGAGLHVPIPIPSSSGRREGAEVDGVAGAGAPTGGDQLRPAAAVRYQCLEGALRSLLDTRFVFAESDAVAATRATGTAGATEATTPQATTPGGQRLLVLLGSVTERLPKVMQALLRASVETQSSPRGVAAAGLSGRPSAPTSGATENTPLAGRRARGGAGGRGGAVGGTGSSTNELKESNGSGVTRSEQAKKSAALKSMYRRSLTSMRVGGEGAYAMLAGLAVEYEAM